jgi:glyoxylase-like metal-dependent hydrolase (beta-lactamase superfamily II)
MKKNLILLVLLSFIFIYSSAQKDSLIKVTDRLYVITGLGGNVTFLTTDEGVIVVDAGTYKKDGLIIMNHVKSVTDKAIKYIVLTHYHFDHVFGVCGIPGNPTVIGHKNIYKNLKMAEPFQETNKDQLKLKVIGLKAKLDSLVKIGSTEIDEVEKNYKSAVYKFNISNETSIVYPAITFDKELTVYLGSDSIKLIHPGNTHSDCEIIVEFPNQKTLAAGDFFFYKGLPYIDSNAHSNTENWSIQARRLSQNNYDHVIPGHGAITTAGELIHQANYLSDLRAAVQQFIDRKKPLEQIQKELKMPKYADYWLQNVLPAEIEAVYKEMTGTMN